MDLKDLQESATNPLWDEQVCKGSYIFPLPMNPDQEICRKIAEGNPENELLNIGPFIVATSPQSHIGPFKHAIDFLVPDGTPVLAAARGQIVECQMINNKWGDSPKFRDCLNYITILHNNDKDKYTEYTQYCHLAKSSLVKGLHIGSYVDKGQQIATTGKTGWTDRDHLHFIVFRKSYADARNQFGFKSLKVNFDQ